MSGGTGASESPQWRRKLRGGAPVSHAFKPGRRFSLCGQAERVSEAQWGLSTLPGGSCVCLACARRILRPPSIDDFRALLDLPL